MAHRAGLIAITTGLLVLATASVAGSHGRRASSAINRAAARADAAHELALVRLPRGAMRVSADASAGRWFSGSPLAGPTTPNLVDRHAFWRVSADPAQLYAWMMAHQPGGSTLAGCSCDGNVPYYVTYAFPSQGKRVDERGVQIGVASASGGGAAVRADAQAVWRVPRPPWLRIPSSTRVAIRISTPPSSGVTTLASRRKVRMIAHLIDRLPLEQPGYDGCSFPSSLELTLAFGSGTATLARVGDDDQGCGLIELSLPHHPTETLEGGHELAEFVRRLGGITSCHSSRRRSGACLPPGTLL